MTLALCHHCGNWNESEKPKKNTDPRVRTVMDTLESIRGYPSGMHAAEAAGVKKILKQGYDEADIINCYNHLKDKHFFKHIFLNTMTVAAQIGEWKKATPVNRKASYEAAYDKRWSK